MSADDEDEYEDEKKIQKKIPSSKQAVDPGNVHARQLFDKLMNCCRLALPDWTFGVIEKKHRGRTVKGVRFVGDYAVPP